MRRRRRYERDDYRHDEYGPDYRLEPNPWGGFYPPAPRGGGVLFGLEGGGPAPFEPIGMGPYGSDYRYTRRVHPVDSPTYGRRGDREVRRWARTHGYVEDGVIPPRPTRRRPMRGTASRPARGSRSRDGIDGERFFRRGR